MRYYQLVEWVLECDTTADTQLFLSVSTFPTELSCETVPNDIKEVLLIKYNQLLIKYMDKLSLRNKQVIDTCINICQPTEPDNVIPFKETIEYIRKYETVRKNNFLDVWPELSKYAQ
jgi:hypothetical protein